MEPINSEYIKKQDGIYTVFEVTPAQAPNNKFAGGTIVTLKLLGFGMLAIGIILCLWGVKRRL